MAKQKGRAFLIKVGDGQASEVFASVAGLTSKSLKINNERIDVTTPDASNPEGAFWRETLDGMKSISVSGDATIVDDAAEARLVAVANSESAVANFQIVVPTVGTYEGAFSLELEWSGDDKLTCSMSLESTGEITFTAAA